jgi:hypothetical protein
MATAYINATATSHYFASCIDVICEYDIKFGSTENVSICSNIRFISNIYKNIIYFVMTCFIIRYILSINYLFFIIFK